MSKKKRWVFQLPLPFLPGIKPWLAALTRQFHGAGVQTCTLTLGQKGGVTEELGLKDLEDEEGEGGGQGSEVRQRC